MKYRMLILAIFIIGSLSTVFASTNTSSFDTTLYMLGKLSPDARITTVDTQQDSMTQDELMYIIEQYHDVLKANELTYIDEVFDCDDFARLFQTISSLANVVFNKQFACGFIAVHNLNAWGGIGGGEDYYHAVNIVILEGIPCIIEPQNFEIIDLLSYPNNASILSIDF